MNKADATFVVGFVRRHIGHADGVVEAFAGLAHHGYDVVAWAQLLDLRSHLLDQPEALMTQDQKVLTRRGRPVQAGVNLPVGAVQAYAQHLDKNAPAVLEIIHSRHRQLHDVSAVGLAWHNGNSFHRHHHTRSTSSVAKRGPTSRPRGGCE